MGFNSSQSNNAVQAIMGIGNTLSNTNSTATQYGTEAMVASGNATLDQMAAQNATQRGIEGAQKYGRAFSQAFGQTKSDIIGSGTDATQGSALNRLNDLSSGGALDELTIRNNAANDAYGFNQKANQETTMSQLDLLKQKTAIGSGLLTAGLQGLKWGQENVDLGGKGGPGAPPNAYNLPGVP